MTRRIKMWSAMLAEKDERRSKVYREGTKLVYDEGDLPEGLAATVGSVLCLQRRRGISATQMPGNAEDWVVLGGGSGSGGGCACGFTTAQLRLLKGMAMDTDSGILTIRGKSYQLTPAQAPTQKYTLTVLSSNTAQGTVTGGGTYAAGPNATITATPNSGFHFLRWNDGSTAPTRTVAVTQNATYTATFEAEEPAPTETPDYYAGAANGTRSEFNELTDAQLAALATGYTTAQQPQYEHTFGDKNIFFLLYRSDSAPQSVVLHSGGQNMPQDLEQDNSFAGHADVAVDGTQYKLFGLRMPSGYEQTDSITVTFNN